LIAHAPPSAKTRISQADQLGFEIEPDAGTTAEFDIGV
jgi:hypothetical protein